MHNNHALMGFLGSGGLSSQVILSVYLIFCSSLLFRLEDLFNVGS